MTVLTQLNIFCAVLTRNYNYSCIQWDISSSNSWRVRHAVIHKSLHNVSLTVGQTRVMSTLNSSDIPEQNSNLICIKSLGYRPAKKKRHYGISASCAGICGPTVWSILSFSRWGVYVPSPLPLSNRVKSNVIDISADVKWVVADAVIKAICSVYNNIN